MDEFVRIIRMMRYCHIAGRYGGGKTTLALKVADKLVRSGAVRYVVVNAPLAVPVPYTMTFDELSLSEVHDAVMILDEAGQFLDEGNKRTLRAWFSYLRKRNQIILMPSVMPVIRYASGFRCQRLFNGMQLGLPVWLYRWRLKFIEQADQGYFLWWNPAEVFGLVDTNYEPDGSWYIYDFGDEAIETTSDEGDEQAEWASAVGVGIGSGSAANAVPGGDHSSGYNVR